MTPGGRTAKPEWRPFNNSSHSVAWRQRKTSLTCSGCVATISHSVRKPWHGFVWLLQTKRWADVSSVYQRSKRVPNGPPACSAVLLCCFCSAPPAPGGGLLLLRSVSGAASRRCSSAAFLWGRMMLSTEFDCPSVAPAIRRGKSGKAGGWGGLALVVRARSGARPSGNASQSLRQVAIAGRCARRCACKELISRRGAGGCSAAAPALPYCGLCGDTRPRLAPLRPPEERPPRFPGCCPLL